MMKTFVVLVVWLLSFEVSAAPKINGFYRMMSYEDGSFVSEAVAFQSEPKGKDTDEVIPDELTEDGSVLDNLVDPTFKGKLDECDAIINTVSKEYKYNYNDPSVKSDYMLSEEKFRDRIDIMYTVWHKIAYDHNWLDKLFEKKGFKGYIKRWKQMEEWRRDGHQWVFPGTGEGLKRFDDENKRLYLDLVNEIMKEYLYEWGGMSKYEEAYQERNRCRLLAFGAEPDMVGYQVYKIARMIDERWNGYWAFKVKKLKGKKK